MEGVTGDRGGRGGEAGGGRQGGLGKGGGAGDALSLTSCCMLPQCYTARCPYCPDIEIRKTEQKDGGAPTIMSITKSPTHRQLLRLHAASGLHDYRRDGAMELLCGGRRCRQPGTG